ncbi:MAG: hypothetical protein ACO3AF_04665 [Flavobacteriales bacterium]
MSALLKRVYLKIALVVGTFLSACTSPECLDCTAHSGTLPKTLICQDTYEALPQVPKLSWSDFSNKAIEQGCEPANR